MRGRVVRILAGVCWVDDGAREWPCKVRKRLLKSSRTFPIAVGDTVVFEPVGAEGVVTARLQRKTKLSREAAGDRGVEQVIAANIDQVVVVASVRLPPLSFTAIDRLLVSAESGGLASLVCINKVDLGGEEDAERARALYERVHYRVVLTSARTGQGIEALRAELRDKVSVFAGESGVGKSSILMAIQPGLKLVTREVSTATERGRHATTHVSLLKLSFGGYVLDTPGITHFKNYNIKPADLQLCFPEFAEWAARCRFRNCLHRNEPGCAVSEAARTDAIPAARYASYLEILGSIIERQRPDWETRKIGQRSI